jgi:predicted metal-binding membrane protein
MGLAGGGEARSTGPRPWPAAALRASAASVLVTLVGFAALAWFMTVRQAGSDSMGMGMSPLLGRGDAMVPSASGMSADGAMASMGLPLFMGMWVTMMVAMMFPSVAPMVVGYSRFSRLRNRTRLATPVFVGGYLLAWTLVGLLAFAAYRALLVATASLSARQAALLAGASLALAGAYQLTRFKTVCLRHCRTPLDFLLHWRAGLGGAARMGAHHGLFCVGCCWGLMLVLLAVGLTNLTWMALVAAVIFDEKLAPFGWATARVVGAALLALGAGVVFVPAAMALVGG